MIEFYTCKMRRLNQLLDSISFNATSPLIFDWASRIFRTNLVSVGSVFNDTRKVKVLSLPETIKEKSTFRDEGPWLETSIFPLSFQVVREPLPFA